MTIIEEGAVVDTDILNVFCFFLFFFFFFFFFFYR